MRSSHVSEKSHFKLSVVLGMVGISLFLYPIISRYFNYLHESNTIATYTKNISTIRKSQQEEFLDEAYAYNAFLKQRSTHIAELSQEEYAEYERLLNTGEDGIMGYIDIAEINLRLPIYHGVSTSSLSKGVGHFPGSSLPVGGESTHAVLSAHAGSPNAQLFSKLHELREGSRFKIYVYQKVLTYEVTSIVVKKPADTEFLMILDGEDLCTLTTCTPKGINSDRLCVTAKRVEDAKNPVWENAITNISYIPCIVCLVFYFLFYVYVLICVA